MKNILRYGLCAAFAAGLTVIYASNGQGTVSDGLTLSALLLLSAGAWRWAMGEGALDALGFAIGLLLPGRRSCSYGDYVAEKRKKGRPSYGFLLLSGGIAMILALLCMSVG